MTRASTAFLSALLLTAGTAALAQAPTAAPAPGQAGRYSVIPAEGGFVRLDTLTGEITHCAQAAGAFSCSSAAERKELSALVTRLEERIGGIGKDLSNLKAAQNDALLALGQQLQAIEAELPDLRAAGGERVDDLDDRTEAIAEQLSDISGTLAVLRRRVDGMEADLVEVAKAAPPESGADEKKLTPEDEKELDKMMSFAERMMRRFFEMVGSLQKEMGGK